jgi:Concanavalin A-like lectin/glucanases superfamily
MSLQKRNLLSVSAILILIAVMMIPLLTDGSGFNPSGFITANTCTANQYGNSINGTGYLGCSQVGYNQLNNFPSGCSSNQYATQIGSSLTCAPIAQDYRLGLVGYWPFDSNSTDTGVPDLSGYGNVGTLMNKPIYLPGLIGSALNFTEADSEYVNISPYPALNASFTLNVWFKTSDSYLNPPLIFHGYNGAEIGFIFRLVSGEIFCGIQNSTAYTQVGSVGTYNNGKWQMASCTYNEGTKSIGSSLAIYDNGTVLESENIHYFGSLANLNAFHIGGDSAFNYWGGLMDEIRIYDFSLSSDQIQNLYQYYQNILNGV